MSSSHNSYKFPYIMSFRKLPGISLPDRRTLVDLNTNKIQNARLIDPTTRDYMINSYGYTVGMPVIQQQVYMALLTPFGSTAIPNFGAKFYNTKVITPNIQAQFKNYINSCLDFLTSRNKISLNNVSVSVSNDINGTILIQVAFTDLTTKQSYIASIQNPFSDNIQINIQ